ncbi:Hypothetical predicted protein, partial [Marmota monax]
MASICISYIRDSSYVPVIDYSIRDSSAPSFFVNTHQFRDISPMNYTGPFPSCSPP